MNDKSHLRSQLRKKRAVLASGSEGILRARRLQERILSSALWKDCRRVAAYVSVKGEVGTDILLAEAWRTGRELFLPRCRPKGEAGLMDMISCSGPEKLEESPFGIPEPRIEADSRLLSPEELSAPDTLIIVPGLAFDRQGYRLGYGGGYYDRLLDRAACPCVGMVFHDLLCETLPRDAWDRPVRAVCTEEILLWS